MKAYFLRSIYLYLSFAGMYLTLEETLGLFANGNVILFLLGIDCLFLSFVRWKWGRIFWYGWNGLVFITGAFLWKKVFAGYLVVENGGRKQLSSYYHMTLAQKKVPIEGEQGELFLVLALTLLVCVLGTLVVQKGRVAMLALIQMLVFTLELVCGSSFRGPGIYLVVLSVFALWAMGNRRGGKNQGILFSVGVWAGSILLLLAFVCGALLGPALYKRADKLNRELYGKVQEVTAKMSSAVRSQNGLWGDHTPTADGSLNNYQVEQSDETDLEVTVSEKPEQTMYLRGFIGDTYEGTYWHRIDEDEFYKEFSEKDAAYQIQNILYRYVQKRAQEEENTAVVRRLQPGGEYGYVPYGFQVPDDGNLVGDSYYASTEEELEYSGYVKWSALVGNGPAPEAESEIEEIYREYVAQQYLKVPVEGLDRLKEYCAQYDFGSVQEVLDFVVPTVQEGRPYSMELEPVPAGKDFAEYFFFDQKKGYCIHYATTATLMLRLMGVPARYVTGYMVNDDDFVESAGGFTAKVPDSQAHAWVEVYREGKGWIPVEVTPGYASISSEESENQGGSSDLESQTTMPEPTPVQETATPEPEREEELQPAEPTHPTEEEKQAAPEVNGENNSDGAMMAAILRVFLGIFAVAAAAFLCWTGILLRRKRILKNRQQRFMRQDRNRGICEISYGLYQMLRDADVCREYTMEDGEYARMMEDELKILEKGEYEAFLRLVQQAAYGNQELGEEQRKGCLGFYRKIAVYLWKHMDKRKKFWWKYMKCYEIS